MRKIPIVLFVLLFFSCEPGKKKTSDDELEPAIIPAIQVSPQSYTGALPGNLRENSGLIFYDKLLWTINDSGGRNKIYGFNKRGEIEREIQIKDAKNVDWESIAQDDEYIYIGDLGNNHGNRKNLTIYKISKREIDQPEALSLNSEKIEFSYGNQSDFSHSLRRTAFDCEAMIVLDSSVFIFTKDWKNLNTTVYKFPKTKGKYSPLPVNDFDVNGLITGAAISPDKSELALLGYRDFKPIIWIFYNFREDDFFGGEKTLIEMDSIYNAQTEGICFLNQDTILFSCERSSSFREQVFMIDTNTLK